MQSTTPTAIIAIVVKTIVDMVLSGIYCHFVWVEVLFVSYADILSRRIFLRLQLLPAFKVRRMRPEAVLANFLFVLSHMTVFIAVCVKTLQIYKNFVCFTKIFVFIHIFYDFTGRADVNIFVPKSLVPRGLA